MSSTHITKATRPCARTLIIAAVTVTAAAILGFQILHTRANRRPNVLLITLDTVRADHLGCYGDDAARTPVLDALAADGARFSDALSVAFGTTPSHISIMTSLYARQHGVPNNSVPMAASQITLARILKDNGYSTAAFVSALPVDSDRNFHVGFDVFNQEFDPDLGKLERRADATTDAALSWFRDAPRKPFFVWIHYFDVHMKYDPPEPFRGRALPAGVGEGEIAAAIEQARKGRATARQKAILKALYDGEISFTDSHAGRVIQWLKRNKLYENTLIIVVGDHGETLDEPRPGPAFDHTTVYQEVAHVPLIVRLPGRARRGVTVNAPVCTLDILPTILEQTRIPAPAGLTMQGESLVRRSRGHITDQDKARSIFFETTDHYGAGVKRGSMKYLKLRNPTGYFQNPAMREAEQLFNLARDPGERKNLAGAGPDKNLAELRSLVAAWEKSTPRRVPRRTLDDEKQRAMREKLKGLGYVR